MAPIDLKNPGRPIRVGVILTASTTEILDIAPVDIFTGLTQHMIDMVPPGVVPDEFRQQVVDFEYHWVTENAQDAKLSSGGTMKATDSFDTCPTLDITLMGAHLASYTMTPGEIAFLQKCQETAAANLFICGGMMTALTAGMLEGKTATAPRPMIDGLQQMAPGVKWVKRRWVRDGKVWTSGTLLNGQDMMRAFVLDTWGKEGSLASWVINFGGWPDRDVDYKDVEWEY